MYPQRTCPRRCKVTLAAFVWVFTTLCFQNFPHGACVRGFKITLVAFVHLFSTLCCKIFPQSACLSKFEATMVGYVWPLNIFWQSWTWSSYIFSTFLKSWFSRFLSITQKKEKRAASPEHYWCRLDTGSFKSKLNIVFGLKLKSGSDFLYFNSSCFNILMRDIWLHIFGEVIVFAQRQSHHQMCF